MSIRLMWRKSLNYVMLTLTGVAAFAVVSILFLILGYLIYNGGRSLNWAFFTQLPNPSVKQAAEWPTRSSAA